MVFSNAIKRSCVKLCVWLFVVHTTSLNGQGLSEISPSIAVASESLTNRLKSSLNAEAEKSWIPDRERVLAALSFIESDAGQRDIIKLAPAGLPMEPSLNRLKRSRFQIFGLVIDRRKHLLVDATPLESDTPELWLKDCISHNVFDGGPAYWWVLLDADSMKIRSCGRRP